MDITEAILTAIEYETTVRNVYIEAAKDAKSDVGLRVFKLMAEEEEQHVSYLKHKLTQWREKAELSSDDLKTRLPAIDEIRAAADGLQSTLAGEKSDAEMQHLIKARDVEIETSNYYKSLVAQLPAEGKRFFERFVEIEGGHLALVEAEMNAVEGMGFWFDMPEFRLENA